MSYQVLARKWRPRNFDELVGQEHVVRALRNALDGNRVHHAFLFTGTRGVGKTTLARVLAKSLNCEIGVTSSPCGHCAACVEIDEGRFVDLIEVDAASRAKVDQTRDLMDNVQFAPSRGRHKVYLIDEVHMFSTASFNALLKTLEEPPPHVKFLLATTDPQKVPVTVLSRCLQFNLKRLPVLSISDHLDDVLARETVAAEAGATALIARSADGSMRDALSLLDQAIAYGAGRLQLDDVKVMLGTVDRQHVHAILEALRSLDGPALLATLKRVSEDGVDPHEVLDELLRALQRIAVLQAVPGSGDGGDEWDTLAAELQALISPEDVQLFYQIALLGRRDLGLAPDPLMGLEMTLLRMLAFNPAGAGNSPGSGPLESAPPESSPNTPPRPFTAAPGARPDSIAAPAGSPPAATLADASNASPQSESPAAAARRAAGIGLPGNGSGRTAPAAPQVPPPIPPQRSAPIAQAAREPFSDNVLETPRETGVQNEAAIGVPVERANGSAPASPAPDQSAKLDLTPSTWNAVVRSLGLSGLAGELASNCELADAQGGVLRLRIAPRHEQLTNASIRGQLGQALEAYTQRRVEIRFEVDQPGGETPAEERRRLAIERHAAAVQAISADPGVQAICDAFGAEVDPQLVRPID